MYAIIYKCKNNEPLKKIIKQKLVGDFAENYQNPCINGYVII